MFIPAWCPWHIEQHRSSIKRQEAHDIKRFKPSNSPPIWLARPPFTCYRYITSNVIDGLNMAPRATVHQNAAARTAAARQKLKDAGYRQIAVWLPERVLRKLDKLAAATATTRAEVIEGLIRKA